MLISTGAARVLDEIAARERDVTNAFAAGAVPESSDTGREPAAMPSLDPLSAVPPERTYFAVRTPDGRTLYTRDGTFRLNGAALVDERGNAVLGCERPGAAPAPVRIDPVDAALGIAERPRIGTDGQLAYERAVTDPRTGNREIQHAFAGRLALARFPAGTRLQPVDVHYLVAAQNLPPHVGYAGEPGFGMLQTQARDLGGVDLDAGLDRLREAYLALDAIRAADVAERGTQKTAMDLLK